MFRPQLSKKSMKMAEKLGPATDRLLNVKKDASDKINPKILPQAPTFSPSINAVS